MRNPSVALLLVTILSTSATFAGDTSTPPPDITVAADGSGNFTTVQAALQSIPRNNTQRITVLVKDGVYKERLRVDAPFVTLMGQSRKNTRIEFDTAAAGGGGGGGGGSVMTLGGNDFILQNITVRNSGTATEPHAVTISSSTADRVVFIDSDVLSEGGDTLSLWNNDGRYYHARCTFRGAVDFVCPHGWCYIVDSKFQETRDTAAIWQDGKGNKEKRFVLRNCRFDGVEGYHLGRHHHDALFFLIDCSFSKTMIDRPIYRVIYPLDGGPPSAADIQNNLQHDPTNIWGERNYFFNCHRDGPTGEKGGGDFAFFKDNLAAFSPTLKPEQITAAWTFAGSASPWNPEDTNGPKIKSIETRDNQIAVTFSEKVTAKGKPSLTLVDGSAAGYASGSGTDTLLFNAAAPTSKVKALSLADGLVLASQASASLRMADTSLPK